MILTQYIQAAMSRAEYVIDSDGSYFGSIPEWTDVCASEQTLEECRQALQATLEEFIVLALSTQTPIPEIGEHYIDPSRLDELTPEELAEVDAAIESARTEEIVSLAEVMDVRTPA